ncbi:MAG: hypothetical protein JKY08_07935 [Flavobacteriaceae bacterium]|nr:hypothetical protein [Flavobacteriaceae bacterium]
MKKLFVLKYNNILFLLSIIAFTYCSVQQAERLSKVRVIELKDSITKPHYIYFNELKVISNNKILKEKIILEIQNLSENKDLRSSIPNQRLKQKMTLSKKCNGLINVFDCNYVPEGYVVLSKQHGILNIKYSYNQYGSYDEYFKYACFNLKIGERINYPKMFTSPKSVLKMYNKKYVLGYETYLKKNNSQTADEYNIEEYEVYKEHLENRTSFQLKSLNNIELIYNQLGEITHIRFHHNGQGGAYKRFFPKSYEEFTIKELEPYLREGFKKITKINL